MVKRKILHIDRDKCTGCGLCVPSCAEGALQVIDGKLTLINENLCDGLGACLGECPYDAISIVERDSDAFDSEAVKRHLTQHRNAKSGCPSVQLVHHQVQDDSSPTKEQTSKLTQWPIQLTLVPSNIDIFKNANLLIAADCVPFAFANFHEKFLKNHSLLIGCPKLDNREFYLNKLVQIFKTSNIQNIRVVNMEVPCCQGLYHLVRQAVTLAGTDIPITQDIISIKGKRISRDSKISPKIHVSS
jgi:NAD-dependent dihydropyrimidine dehydrogenase PreA subunit